MKPARSWSSPTCTGVTAKKGLIEDWIKFSSPRPWWLLSEGSFLLLRPKEVRIRHGSGRMLTVFFGVVLGALGISDGLGGTGMKPASLCSVHNITLIFNTHRRGQYNHHLWEILLLSSYNDSFSTKPSRKTVLISTGTNLSNADKKKNVYIWLIITMSQSAQNRNTPTTLQ